MYDLTQDYPKITEALREQLFETFVSECDQYGIADENDVQEVSAKSYDGFIAHTNGGFRAIATASLRDVESNGMGDFETACLQPYLDMSRRDAAAAFIEDNEELDSAYQASDSDDPATWLWNRWSNFEDMFERQGQLWPIEFWRTPEYAEREQYYETEDHWLTEGGTFFYECRALFYQAGEFRNITGEDEVYIFAGINTDFEYGREKGLQTAFERTYKLKRLTPARLRVIIERCKTAVLQ
jgi:hypothetical protein